MEIDIQENCPDCGDNMYVRTERGHVYDGDTAECWECDFKCGYSVYEDGTGSLQD